AQPQPSPYGIHISVASINRLTSWENSLPLPHSFLVDSTSEYRIIGASLFLLISPSEIAPRHIDSYNTFIGNPYRGAFLECHNQQEQSSSSRATRYQTEHERDNNTQENLKLKISPILLSPNSSTHLRR